MSEPPPWDLLRTFLTVMREGSLSAAARSLGIAQATVRRHVEQLEAMLEVAFFTRSPNGLMATDAARQALPYAESIEAMAGALTRIAGSTGDAATGTVRLTCSEVMAVEVLPPMLAAIMVDHPAVEIELVASNRIDDLLRRDADLAVRLTRPTQTGLLARTLGVIDLGLYASRSYLMRHEAPRDLAALVTDHRLVGDDRRDAIRQGLAALGADVTAARFAFRTDSDLAQLAAIRAGVGVGVCQVGIARRDERLCRVLPAIAVPIETWLVMHEDLRSHPAVRVVFDALADALSGMIRDHSR